ncbi:MAG TPA: DUF4062 domain-containing protein [Polyangiaceae bacterium]|nr:DUF4062 domain-containing protein [Polyangiaceae bacterium]
MAETIYRTFISSTKDDLIRERLAVHEAVIDCECFPAAMEQFVASHDDQWTYITREIARCDFYIVIVGGRYGSCIRLGPSAGTSYTEAEYDHAVERGLYVMGFIKKNPSPPAGSSGFKEDMPDAAKRIASFKEKVGSRMCSMFSDEIDLYKSVTKAINFAKGSGKALGYVRPKEISNNGLGAGTPISPSRFPTAEKAFRRVTLRPAKAIHEVDDIDRLERDLGWSRKTIVFEVSTVVRNKLTGAKFPRIYHPDMTWKDAFLMIAMLCAKEPTSEEIMMAGVGRRILRPFVPVEPFANTKNAIVPSSFYQLKGLLLGLGLVSFHVDKWRLTDLGVEMYDRFKGSA